MAIYQGTFVVCNAIICSSAGWSLGIAQSISRRSKASLTLTPNATDKCPSVDINGYLVFLGALALAFVVVTFVDFPRSPSLSQIVADLDRSSSLPARTLSLRVFGLSVYGWESSSYWNFVCPSP